MTRIIHSRFVRSGVALTSAALAALSFTGANATPVAADTLAGVIVCTASLPQFPGNSIGSCNGSATGVHGTSPLVAASFASQFNYSEVCPPVEGTASGNTTFNGSPGPNFSWIRVGLTAVLTLNHGGVSGAAAGLFVPTTVLGTGALVPPCAGAGPVTAEVVAVGVDAL